MHQYSVIGISVQHNGSAPDEINKVLSEYGEYVIGRMGIRRVEKGLSIIALIVEGHTDIIGAITGKLGSIPGVKVRSGLLKDN